MIRRAEKKDIPQIEKLLYQVNNIHAEGRPDLFKKDYKKYTEQELEEILLQEERPVFAAVDGETLLGYAFCVFQQPQGNNMQPVRTLYIDDLCVDEKNRGQHVGKQLYDYVLEYAKKNGCYNVTLNVWACNESARRFYDKCGLRVQKTGLEIIL